MIPAASPVLSRRAALGALVLPLVPVGATVPDPVFAAIKTAAKAEDAFRAALEGITDGDDEAQAVAAEAVGFASDHALDRLMATRPTTFAGLRALVRFLGEEAERNGADDPSRLLRLAAMLDAGGAIQ